VAAAGAEHERQLVAGPLPEQWRQRYSIFRVTMSTSSSRTVFTSDFLVRIVAPAHAPSQPLSVQERGRRRGFPPCSRQGAGTQTGSHFIE
jgi:hypothetical protein